MGLFNNREGYISIVFSYESRVVVCVIHRVLVYSNQHRFQDYNSTLWVSVGRCFIVAKWIFISVLRQESRRISKLTKMLSDRECDRIIQLP